ncbi:MAG: HNH endonuclease [Planctomycetota bacterium]|nr:HNH endonuclease [Planctomycetota bacterium]
MGVESIWKSFARASQKVFSASTHSGDRDSYQREKGKTRLVDIFSAKRLIGGFLLQGNPSRFDMDRYLDQYEYVYWNANRYVEEMQIGDTVFFLRSGKDAGVIAMGVIAELPCKPSDVQHPESLAKKMKIKMLRDSATMKVGVQLVGERRFTLEDLMVPRSYLATDPQFCSSPIIKAGQGTVFTLDPGQVSRLKDLWSGAVFPEFGGSKKGANEGAILLRTHRIRDRKPQLREDKKLEVLQAQGVLICEVCHRSSQDLYPLLSDEESTRIFEVHHKVPLSELKETVHTTTDDLALLCANCHRIVHRDKHVQENYEKLILDLISRS